MAWFSFMLLVLAAIGNGSGFFILTVFCAILTIFLGKIVKIYKQSKKIKINIAKYLRIVKSCYIFTSSNSESY